MKYATVDHPFPGLRPFELGDREFFFGREDHIDTLYEKLLAKKVMAVVGSSGSGKSSLVRAGLLGRLSAVSEVEGSASWKTIVLRPLGNPIQQLAHVLAQAASGTGSSEIPQRRSLAPLATDRAAARLFRSSLGLVELLKELTEGHAHRVLIIVDQFEELFRYAAAHSDQAFDEHALFVKHLLRAAADPSVRTHVLITMRSEFIGDCAQFPDLPQAISESQFLTPRLTRTQRREAILGPLRLARGDIAPGLLQRILNDVGHETDQLPVLQHALMRTWQAALPSRNLTLAAYESIGAMDSAISMHAEGMLQNRTATEGPPERRSDVEKRDLERIFRALADVDRDGRATRRPTRFGELADQCSSPEAAAVLVDIFRDEDCAFLSPNKATPLRDDTIVDITHEALIRKWTTLAAWVEREHEDGKNILRLHDLAARRKVDPEFVLAPREAAERNRWWQTSQPSPTWARRYLKGEDGVTFEDIRDLLEASVVHAARTASLERQAKEAQLEVERLLREKAERETREKDTELQLAQMARKLAEAQRQKLAAEVPARSETTVQSVFISHASGDRDTAVDVYDWLLEQGVENVHLDIEPGRIEPGRRWESQLEDSIRSASGVVLLVSPEWTESRSCRRELEIARESGVELIPIAVKPVDLLAPAARLLADIQIVDWNEKSAREQVRSRLAQLGLLEEFFRYVPGRSPYPGLAGFDEEDAAVFFGRSVHIAEAMDRLRLNHRSGGCHVVVILGASGSGKSSFLRAGLWARLKRDRANFLCMPILRPLQWRDSPGARDFPQIFHLAFTGEDSPNRRSIATASDIDGERLEAELRRASERAAREMNQDPERNPVGIALAVDQAEELFRIDVGEDVRIFLGQLGSIVRRNSLRLTIILAIRSDAYEQLQIARELAGIRQETLSLPPIPATSFRAVIEGPARVAGLSLEPMLVERLLADLEQDHVADALPLLAFILERLYAEYGAGGALRLSDYESLGGFRGAIELAIERALARARADPAVPQDRADLLALLRRAFIPALVTIDTETGAPRRRIARLSDIPEPARPVLAHLVEERLLVTDARAGTGDATIEVAHEAMLRQWGLLRAWLTEDADLLQVLERVRRAAHDWEVNRRSDAWLNHSGERLADAERLYHRADLASALGGLERAYLQASRNRETAAERRRRSRQWLLAAAAVLCVLIAALAAVQWLWAKEQRMQAENEKLRAESALQAALVANLRAGGAISPDATRMLALDADGKVGVIDLASGRDVGTLSVANGRITSVAFSHDGTKLVTAASNSEIVIWDAVSLVQIVVLKGHTNTIRQVVFSPDGRLIASGGDDKAARIWSADTGSLVHVIPLDKPVVALAFSPDGTRLIISTASGAIYLTDSSSGAVLRYTEPPP